MTAKEDKIAWNSPVRDVAPFMNFMRNHFLNVIPVKQNVRSAATSSNSGVAVALFGSS